jgi:hypothetical protein
VVHFQVFFPNWNFSLFFLYIIKFAGRISEAAMDAILRVKEPKKQVCAVHERARAAKTN